MNRIDRLFETKKGNILSVYFTAGYPAKKDTATIIKTLEEAGADLIEIGFPFSDPMADGPVIQGSNKVALENGMNLPELFKQVKALRKDTDIPLVLMGYLNPVLNMGMEAFCKKCRDAGIDGIILPDLPVEAFQQYKTLFDENNLYNIFLTTPTTSQERLEHILKDAKGFVYMVSSSSTTGKAGSVMDQLSHTKNIKKVREDLPVMVGFGIDHRDKFQQVCRHAEGGIIGSAFIKALGNTNGDLPTRIRSFIQSIRPTNT